MILFGQIFWSFVFVFFLCEFGERVSSGFEGLNETLNSLQWYSFPIEIQRMIPTAMIIFQAQTVIPIVGKISCSRYIFDKVSAEIFVCRKSSEFIVMSLSRFQIINRAFSCAMLILRMRI